MVERGRGWWLGAVAGCGLVVGWTVEWGCGRVGRVGWAVRVAPPVWVLYEAPPLVACVCSRDMVYHIGFGGVYTVYSPWYMYRAFT